MVSYLPYSGSARDVAVVYGVVSGVWILLSDRLVAALIDDPSLSSTVQTAKGWLFVVGSALLIFGLVRHSQRSHERTNERLDHALQQTSVLHRILRHNLRNSCNVIAGNAELLADHFDGSGSYGHERGNGESQRVIDGGRGNDEERIDRGDGGIGRRGDPGDRVGGDDRSEDDADRSGGPGPDSEECLETIREQTDQLVTITEKTRLLRDMVLEERSEESIDLASVIVDRIDVARERFPAAAFDAELPERCRIRIDPIVGMAVDELLENAVEHSDRDAPTVRVALDERADGSVRIEVADDGPGMPEMERAMLEEGMESPTVHSEGLGLWIARTAVVQNDGEIEIVDNELRGTIVRIVLP